MKICLDGWVVSRCTNCVAATKNKTREKEFQGVLTCEHFEALTSAVLTENIAEIYRLLQHCGVTGAGRVYCEDGSSINLLFAAITTYQSDMVELLVEE